MTRADVEEQLAKIEPFSGLKMRLAECSADKASMEIGLDGNRNDKSTMFAGSIYGIMVVTGWALARMACEGLGCRGDVVIKDSETSFLSPVRSDATATAELTAEPRRKSNGNILVETIVTLRDQDGAECAGMKGRYIGLNRD